MTDVQMPGTIDGLVLVEIIKRDFPAIRSIVTSGRSNLSDARKSGAGEFLSKPYSAASIGAAVRKAMAA